MGLAKLKYMWVDIQDEWEHNIKWRLFVRRHGISYFEICDFSWVGLNQRIGAMN